MIGRHAACDAKRCARFGIYKERPNFYFLFSIKMILASIFALALSAVSANVSTSAAANKDDAPIQWLKVGNNFAETTETPFGGITILYDDKIPNGAQLKYKKLAEEGPLVDVVLVNDKFKVDMKLMGSFSMIAQKCSCWWVDAAKDFKGKGLKSSKYYQLEFRSADFTSRSGYFGMKFKGSEFDQGVTIDDDTNNNNNDNNDGTNNNVDDGTNNGNTTQPPPVISKAALNLPSVSTLAFHIAVMLLNLI
jgi:hypothetical protein